MSEQTNISQTTRVATQTSEADRIAAEAYVFGFPLVLMDVTRAVMTNSPQATDIAAPINQFAHQRAFPDPSTPNVITPHIDTLDSSAWLDVSKEPIILNVPDTASRYYVLHLVDAWTNVFASLGTRTSGNRAAAFAIVGPRWTGMLPAGVREYRSPTSLVWLTGRTQTNGKADYPAVREIQNQFSLTPLSAFGGGYAAPADVPTETGVDVSTPPIAQVARMDAGAFFRRFNSLMVANPPAAADAPALQRFATLGIGPGKALDPDGLDASLTRAVATGGSAIVAASGKTQYTQMNGWEVRASGTGSHGSEYLSRAACALFGPAPHHCEDTVIARIAVDGNGEPLDGSHRYALRFAKGQLPPVNAFWSITMYNDRSAFVPNVHHRYAIGNRDGLKSSDGGAIEISIRRDSPGQGREANWLPTPAGPFHMIMRLYWPKPDVLTGRWEFPSVERVT